MSSLRRIYGVMLRQAYLIRRSFPRIASYIFWPSLIMLTYGFLNKYLLLQTPHAIVSFNVLLGAALLINFYERFNLNIMMAFLEDVWARNIGNILISPIYASELILAMIVNGLMAVMIGISIAWSLAYFCFGYSLLQMGLPLLAFVGNDGGHLGWYAVDFHLTALWSEWGNLWLDVRICAVAALCGILSRQRIAGMDPTDFMESAPHLYL